MAMVECPKCSTQLVGDAKFCSKCGAQVAPVFAEKHVDQPMRVVVTEQTGKKYKALQLVAVFMVCAGTVSCVAHEAMVSSALWLVGLAIFIGARFGAWWDHG